MKVAFLYFMKILGAAQVSGHCIHLGFVGAMSFQYETGKL